MAHIIRDGTTATLMCTEHGSGRLCVYHLVAHGWHAFCADHTDDSPCDAQHVHLDADGLPKTHGTDRH